MNTGRILALGPLVLALSLAGSQPAVARPTWSQYKSFPVPQGSQPTEITLGPDGNLWYTIQNSSRIGRITPGGDSTTFRTPQFSNPFDIVAGPDGNLWFTEGSTGHIGRITTDGEITEFMFSFFGVSSGITVGPDGNIWFTDITANAVWRFDLSSGIFTNFDLLTPNAFPGDITLGADGNLWFVETAVAKIAKITVDGQGTELEEESLDLPGHITSGPDGNIWFTEAIKQRIGRITPDGQFTFYPTDLHTLGTITPGFGQTLLFTSLGDNSVAQITTEGVVTSSRSIPDSEPTGITRGPGLSVWFLGVQSNKVYRFQFRN